MANPALKTVTLHLPEDDLEVYRQQAQAQGVTLEAHVSQVLHQALQSEPDPAEGTLGGKRLHVEMVTVEGILSGRVQPKVTSLAELLNRPDPTPDEHVEEMVSTMYAWRREDKELEEAREASLRLARED